MIKILLQGSPKKVKKLNVYSFNMDKAIEEIFETYALHKLIFLKIPKASFYNNTRLRYSPPKSNLENCTF